MPRIDLPDSRWLELTRPMYISDKQKIVDLEALDGTLLDRMNGYAEILGPAIGAKSWTGSITDMTELRLLNVLAEWAQFTEESVAPKAGGSPSKTTSSPGDSPCRTGGRRRSPSGTRRSGSESAT
jgi:hypothetical protein